MKFQKDILIIDFEGKDEPVQVGAVLLDKETLEEKDSFDSYIYADLDGYVSPTSGITQEMIDTAPSADNAFCDFSKWMKKVSDGSDPIFFCYGKADKLFIERTIHHMRDSFSISFAS